MTTSIPTRTVLRSDEFTCPSCVSKIEKSMRAVPGVTSATVSFETGRIVAEHEGGVALDELIAAVAAAGYHARRSL